MPRHLTQGNVAAGWVGLSPLDLVAVVPERLTAFGGGLTTNRWYVSSLSSSGLKLTQISEPGMRIVGITVRQLFLLTFCGYSTHKISALSRDLMLCTLWSRRPWNVKLVCHDPPWQLIAGTLFGAGPERRVDLPATRRLHQ